MFNVIRMEFYRLLKNKSCYVILLIIAFMAWANVFYISKALNSSNVKYWLSGEPRQTWDLLDSPHLLLGTNYDTSLLVNGTNTVTVFDIVSVLLSSSLSILCTGIFAIIFVLGGTSSGFIKNTVSCIKKRRYIIISDMAVLSLFILMEFAVLTLVTELTSLYFIKQLSHGISIEQLRYMVLQFLLYVAYTEFILFVVTALKNAPVSIILHIFFCWNLGTLFNYYIYNYCTLLINSNVPLSFLNYYLIPNIVLLSANAPYGISIRALLVSVGAILLYSVLSIAVIEKRDI